MGTYSQLYYHIIFGTKHRKPTLVESGHETLYRYINGVLTRKKCVPYAIGGIEDHIHIFTGIRPKYSISDIVKNIKLASSDFIKDKGIFPDFTGWQIGYAVFSYHNDLKQVVTDYVKNQKEHHKKESFETEYRRILKENQIEIDEKYLFE